MNRLPIIINKGRFSLVIYLFSWAVPFNYDGYPGPFGWTHRFRVLCFNLHFRTLDQPKYDKYTDYDSSTAESESTEYDNPYDYEENDIPF